MIYDEDENVNTLMQRTTKNYMINLKKKFDIDGKLLRSRIDTERVDSIPHNNSIRECLTNIKTLNERLKDDRTNDILQSGKYFTIAAHGLIENEMFVVPKNVKIVLCGALLMITLSTLYLQNNASLAMATQMEEIKDIIINNFSKRLSAIEYKNYLSNLYSMHECAISYHCFLDYILPKLKPREYEPKREFVEFDEYSLCPNCAFSTWQTDQADTNFEHFACLNITTILLKKNGTFKSYEFSVTRTDDNSPDNLIFLNEIINTIVEKQINKEEKITIMVYCCLGPMISSSQFRYAQYNSHLPTCLFSGCLNVKTAINTKANVSRDIIVKKSVIKRIELFFSIQNKNLTALVEAKHPKYYTQYPPIPINDVKNLFEVEKTFANVNVNRLTQIFKLDRPLEEKLSEFFSDIETEYKIPKLCKFRFNKTKQILENVSYRNLFKRKTSVSIYVTVKEIIYNILLSYIPYIIKLAKRFNITEVTGTKNYLQLLGKKQQEHGNRLVTFENLLMEAGIKENERKMLNLILYCDVKYYKLMCESEESNNQNQLNFYNQVGICLLKDLHSIFFDQDYRDTLTPPISTIKTTWLINKKYIVPFYKIAKLIYINFQYGLFEHLNNLSREYENAENIINNGGKITRYKRVLRQFDDEIHERQFPYLYHYYNYSELIPCVLVLLDSSYNSRNNQYNIELLDRVIKQRIQTGNLPLKHSYARRLYYAIDWVIYSLLVKF